MTKFSIIFCLFALPAYTLCGLAVSGKHFTYNGQQVFLSGANFAWNNYARDFGSGAYANSKAKMEQWLADIASHGGNAVRTWVHIDGQWSPKFDSSGKATGNDTQSLISELGEFLDAAQKHNIFVILTLWNLAADPSHMVKMYHDETLLTAYINTVLTPMIKGIASKKALAAIDIINEPGGSIKQGITDTNKCFDTNKLTNSGANWVGVGLTAKEVLNFINKHASAIKTAAPSLLVTVGGWEAGSNSVCSGNCYNYYTDECLRAGGGKQNGVIDFYQEHSYTWQGKYSEYSAMKVNADALKMDKAVIVSEFSNDCSESKDAAANWKHIYNGGYAGALAWQWNEGGDCSDKQTAINTGMNAIKDLTTNGKIKVTI